MTPLEVDRRVKERLADLAEQGPSLALAVCRDLVDLGLDAKTARALVIASAAAVVLPVVEQAYQSGWTDAFAAMRQMYEEFGVAGVVQALACEASRTERAP